jgi:hypothetical protein
MWRLLNFLFEHVWPFTRIRMIQDWQDDPENK